jgi:hypothetical protein
MKDNVQIISNNVQLLQDCTVAPCAAAFITVAKADFSGLVMGRLQICEKLHPASEQQDPAESQKGSVKNVSVCPCNMFTTFHVISFESLHRIASFLVLPNASTGENKPCKSIPSNSFSCK